MQKSHDTHLSGGGVTSLPVSRQGSPAVSRRKEILVLAMMLALSAALRLWLLPMPPLKGDMDILASWGTTIRTVPMADFYSKSDPDCDYPPVYLYILKGSVLLQGLVSGSAGATDPDSLVPWIKAGPVVADILLAILAFLLCRRLLGFPRSLIAAALVAFNPGLVFVSAVWGQVDSIPNAFAMASMLALVSRRPNLAALLAGASVLTKPQYVIFLAGPALAYLRAETLHLPPLNAPGGRSAWVRWIGLRVVVPLLAMVATMELAMLPFSESLWPMGGVEWTLWGRTAYRAGKFAFVSVGAFNFWATPIAGLQQPDSTVAWLSLSYQIWGALLMAAAMAPALLLAWRKPNDSLSVVWSSFVVFLSFFVLFTRIHERFLFSAIPLAAVASAINLRLVPYYVATSVLYSFNLWANYHAQANKVAGAEHGEFAGLVPVASILSVVLLVAALAAIPVLLRSRQVGTAIPDGGSLLTSSVAGRRSMSLSALMNWASQSPRRKAELIAVGSVVLAGVFGTGFITGRTLGLETEGVYTVTIDARELWQDTAVLATEGQRFFISARGDWTNKRGGDRFGPGGSRRIVGGTIMPEAPVGVLLGRIGDSAPFVVGESRLTTAPSSGRLQLVMNDWTDDRSDVEGSVTVKIVSLLP